MDQHVTKSEIPTASAPESATFKPTSEIPESVIKGLKKPLHEYKILQPKYALWPSGLILVAAHIFVLSYIFGEFENDYLDEQEEATESLKKLYNGVTYTKNKFREIREKFSAFMP